MAASTAGEPAIAELLLHRVARGDPDAVRECTARFAGLVWSLVRRAGIPDAQAEELTHDIFVEVWRSAGRYDPALSSESTFVGTITHRRLIDYRRRQGRRAGKQAVGGEERMAERAAPSATDPGLSEEARRAVLALSQLTPEQQKILRFSVCEGMSHESIARVTGLPLGTVKTHARRGLMRLRELMGLAGGGAQSARRVDVSPTATEAAR